MTDGLRINGTRLWSRLMDMARVGATDAGGCNRQALTDADRAGRELFTGWCRAAGCAVRVDAIGNIFARRAGTDEELPPVLTGSHLDTQPTGGRFDGIYGVLAGLEVIETLNDHGTGTAHPMELVVWTNEEGCRFDTAMMGSLVWSGNMPLEVAYALTDREGRTVRGELERTGQLGTHPAMPFPVHAAFEAHIEQGPRLESAGIDIGIVTGVQHMSRHRVLIDGTAAHAGTTPMASRRDPMMALAAFLPALYAMSDRYQPDGRLTFGFVHARPGSSNTVPHQVELTVDIRHPAANAYRSMVEEYRQLVSEACNRLELPHSLTCFWEAPGVDFDPICVGAVRRAAAALGHESMEMVSGAGHDACNLAAAAPTSMIFIPCAGGLSHNEAESILPAHAEAGCNVLLHAMLDRSSRRPA